jgi:two-component system, chemotaxis family, sensor kinase CheA
MTQFPDDPGAEMRELFFETSQELLQSLNDDALKLEKSPEDSEVVRSIRRTMHTLKGDAAACGFKELSELAHKLEDALAVGSVTDSRALVELSLKASDVFNAMLSAYRQHTAMPDATAIKRMARSLASGSPAVGSKRKARVPKLSGIMWTEYERKSASVAKAEGKNIFHVVAHIDQLCAMPIAARQMIASELGSIAQVIGIRPEAESAAKAKKLDLLIATSADESAVISKCRIPTVISHAECFALATAASASAKSDSSPAKLSVPMEKSADAPEFQASGTATASHSSSAENILRVGAERIDNVLNLVGELIIAKSMLQQAIQEFTRRYPKDPLRPRFSDAMGVQSRVLNDLQRSVMKIRMVPVEQLFRRFPRIVHDTAKSCGKQAKVIIRGQDTDLDKSLLDAIAEPLTHIVRNAISHGIETPRERELAGKDPSGTIQLNAYHQANQLIVEIEDDGRGIDVAKLKAKAVKEKVISATEAERMSTQEVLDLIYRPGFSTAEQITEISGRGVGLDVVRNVLMRMKGTVENETRPGQGTTFRLKLPLTLAIIQALMFRIEHRLYAVPLNAVAEIARARESDLHRVDTTEVLPLRNQMLPLVRIGQCRISELEPRREKIFVLVLAFGERKLGLVVDALEGEEELVIKALDDHMVATDLVSSASILGDGRVVLIMNLTAVMERFTTSGTEVCHSGSFSRDTEGAAPEVRQ